VRQRWLPVGVLVGLLFVTNVVGRVLAKHAFTKDSSQITVGLLAFGSVALVLIGAGFLWARRHSTPRVIADLGAAAGASCALALVLGPYLVGDRPFAGGLGTFLLLVVYFLALAGFGGFFGVLLTMAFGKDRKSQAWKRYGESVRAKPRRVAR